MASGIADVGFALRGAAADLHLDFVPAGEHYPIRPGDALGAAEPFLIALRAPAVRAAVARLPG